MRVFFSSKKIVGLDIGASSIKMAELDVGRQGAKLLSFGIASLPPGSVNYGEIQNPDALSASIRQMLQSFQIQRKSVALGLAGTAVIVKKITIPRIDKKLLKDQIRWEAEQYIPFDINSISLDYHLIQSDNETDMMDILLIACQNDVVTTYANVVQSAGLDLKLADVSGFALANLFEFNYGKFPGQSIALLNIGATTTNFVVVQNGDLIFCRDINVGGQNYTYEIHKELGVSLVEAESLKLTAVRGEGVPDEVHSVMSSVNESIKDEIRGNFEYFSGANNSAQPIQQCFFTGGSGSTPGLVPALSQSIGLSFEPLNPYIRIQPTGKNLTPEYLDQVSPFATIALGLALRKAGDS